MTRHSTSRHSRCYLVCMPPCSAVSAQYAHLLCTLPPSLPPNPLLPWLCCHPAGFLGAVCGMGFAVSSRVYSMVKGGVPFPSLKHTLADATSTLMPQNLFSMGYSLLTVALAAMSAVCLAATPGANLVLYDGLMGPMTVFMKRVAGAGMVLMTMQAFSLKDAADRGKLGSLTFR